MNEQPKPKLVSLFRFCELHGKNRKYTEFIKLIGLWTLAPYIKENRQSAKDIINGLTNVYNVPNKTSLKSPLAKFLKDRFHVVTDEDSLSNLYIRILEELCQYKNLNWDAFTHEEVKEKQLTKDEQDDIINGLNLNPFI